MNPPCEQLTLGFLRWLMADSRESEGVGDMNPQTGAGDPLTGQDGAIRKG